MREYTEQKIRSLLLGKLPEAESDAMDEVLAGDADLSSLLRDAESNLIDDYLAGRLAKPDATSFETKFLVTTDRLTRLRVAEGMRLMAAEAAPEPVASPLAASYGAHRLAWVVAGLGVLIVVGATFFYLGSLSSGDLDVAEVRQTVPEPIAERNLPAIEQTAPSPNQTAPARPQVAATRTATPTRGGLAKSTAEGTSMTFSLRAGSERSGGEQSVTIPANVRSVTLTLRTDFEATRYRRYHAVLKTPEDGAVYSADRLPAPRFTIDASRLENRTYIVSLEGETKERGVESLADYTFRVRR